MELISRFPSLDEFEPKFAEYASSLEPRIEQWLTEQQKPFDSVFYLLHTYFLLLNYVVDSGALSHSHHAVKMLYSKTTTDIFAIYNCLKNGCPYQATMILRSMFETNAYVLFIYGDFERRIELFYNHRYIEQFQKMQKDPNSFDEYKKQGIIQKYHELKSNYDKKSSWYQKELRRFVPDEQRTNKRKLTLRDLSRFVGIEDDYEKIYGSTSLSVHGSAVLDHMFVSNGKFTSAPIVNNPMLKNTATLALSFAHKNLGQFLSKSNNPEASEVNDYSTWLVHSFVHLEDE